MRSELTERQALLALNAIPGLGPLALNRLLEAFAGDARAALQADRRKAESVLGRGPAASALEGWREHFDPAREELRMAKSSVAFASRADGGYPPLLREIHDPPVGLYRKGPFVFDRPCVAIVGSRRATLYGQSVARRLGAELAQRGFCVVSGLARGIDTQAHEGALSVGGATAAVLGTGIDIIFPPENLGLYRRIAESGVVLTECPFGRPADRDSFPMRSRIISGCCEAVVVVESDLRGGAMTTARLAGEQGRLLFAVPGRIDQSSSAGCNQLIRDGATLLSRVEDLLQELQYLGGMRHAPLASPPGLGPREQLVLGCLCGAAPMTAQEVAAHTGLAAPEAAAALQALESRGLLSQGADGSYRGG